MARNRTAADLGLMSGAPPFRNAAQVTLANWQEAPYNRWAFQHVRDLVPTARIRRGDGPVWRFPHAERDLSRIRFRNAGRDLTVGDLLDRTWTDGFLVLHRGRIVTERYFNGMTPDTPHLLMSVSKSVTSTVAGILAGRGELDVAAPVTSIVPELAGTSFEGATVQQLLDMRTGTRFDETYEDPKADVRLYEQVYLWRPRDGRRLPEDAIAYFKTLRNDGKHGGPFRYRSILTDVLGWVVERAGGARLADLISRELWQPMGAEFDAEVTVDGHGNAMADGGICATLRDLARFGQLFLQWGRRGRQQIVPRAWIQDTIRGAPDGATAFAEGVPRGGTRRTRTTGTSGGCTTRRCPSTTARASTDRTSTCIRRRRRWWRSSRRGPTRGSRASNGSPCRACWPSPRRWSDDRARPWAGQLHGSITR